VCAQAGMSCLGLFPFKGTLVGPRMELGGWSG
jgi:hypothetical protein